MGDDEERGIGDQIAGMFGMGGGILGENQEEEHESGFSRLMSSILCAICCAPCFVMIAIFLWGWNEKRAVCSATSIDRGKDAVKEIDCMTVGAENGELVMFSCEIDALASYETLKIDSGDFGGRVQTVGAGLETIVEMYQCVETKSSTTKKDKVGGGKTTVNTYNYNLEWRSTHQKPTMQDSAQSQEMMSKCGISSEDPNPQFPTSVVAGRTFSNKAIHVGKFEIDKGIYSSSSVPLTTTVRASSTPTGWRFTEPWYEKNPASSSYGALGKLRVKFVGSDTAPVTLTVLGENSGGVIKKWKSDGTWLCDGQNLHDARSGTYTKDELFDAKEDENTVLTWILRILGLGLAWCGFSRVMAPLGVLADCIPCIGPCLGDMVEAIACFIAYFPACICCMFICGIVWAAMRPMVGIPLLLISFAMVGGFAFWKFNKNKEKNGDGGEEPAPENVGRSSSDRG